MTKLDIHIRVDFPNLMIHCTESVAKDHTEAERMISNELIDVIDGIRKTLENRATQK